MDGDLAQMVTLHTVGFPCFVPMSSHIRQCPQDSTHYDLTLELLRKYDPEFAAAEAKQRARLRAQSQSPPPRQADRPPGAPGNPQQASPRAPSTGGQAHRTSALAPLRLLLCWPADRSHSAVSTCLS